MSDMPKYTLAEVNALTPSEFHEIFINVVELCSVAAVFVSALSPFHSLESLIRGFDVYLSQLNVTDKLNVLRHHPDLAGKLAESGNMSYESQLEQQQAGLNSLTKAQKHELSELNDEYKAKFGFPFVICVRETNKLEAILAAMKVRLNNSVEEEVEVGINEVKKISRLRVLQIVKE
ncbi:2-oxo-4-hydroxy-4-carboxy-5-ureidoimidazoline decarboxylase-like [Culicoides brevitarsis]|uniref:2-oxo-4-hydroxy-4-carboxy-5-ureidoimidazoline decarboxylase-like n=1 Tax=Culicoides brevitarsis TaxID=469753 RepID=UPI00307C0DEE